MRSALTPFVVTVAVALTGCAELGFGPSKPPPPKQEDPPIKATAPTEEGFPEADRLVPKAAAKWAANNNPDNPPTVKRTYTIMDDWGMIRDKDSGTITARTVRVVMFTQGNKSPGEPDNKCWQNLCNLSEEKQEEGKWGKPALDCPSDDRVTCKSVEALPER